MYFKARTNEVLLEDYRTNGAQHALNLCAGLLLSPDLKKMSPNHNSRVTVIGELCETALEIAILDYIRSNPAQTKDWFVEKGLILKDMDNSEGDYLTELDFTLFTPQVIIAFECKSYSGDKIIIDRGVITRPGRKKFDVYKQHSKHVEALMKVFNPYTYKQSPPCYHMVYFNFSQGSLKDNRIDKWKNIFPIWAVNDIPSRLSIITGKTVWDMGYVRKAVFVVTKNKDSYSRNHLVYVKSLRDKREWD